MPVPLEVNLTDPLGAIGVPADEVSVTVAVQSVVCFNDTDTGVQPTVVEVVLLATLYVTAPCTGSP